MTYGIEDVAAAIRELAAAGGGGETWETWTPQVWETTANVEMTSIIHFARYSVVGGFVHAQALIEIDDTAGTVTDSVEVRSLPLFPSTGFIGAFLGTIRAGISPTDYTDRYYQPARVGSALRWRNPGLNSYLNYNSAVDGSLLMIDLYYVGE